MPMSFMTGSIVGKRFYQEVTTRMADDDNGWTVMLDYRTLKSPSKRPLKIPSLALAKAIAAEWEYQALHDASDEACLHSPERVPLTRAKIIEHLMKKFHQDLVFCRSPGDSDLTRGVLEKQIENLDPLLEWLESEFGFKPVVHSCFFGGKQADGLVGAIENMLKTTTDCELAAIDALAAAHSLVIPLGLFVDRWGLVEGGHDVDIADLQVQISSAAVFLGLSQRQ
ncbi:unnamed protein product [Spirodela intermedia]|uniref:Uncharacterized protein n=1 Tax=Spirodela intermedia TaxID=51605 RepID=A0A7I8IGP1_SPIIN|nr:unnamed protein product [Spirodela intermedia]CAA6657061.1 unnamed protein product [Spirodela intermedia]